MNYNLCLHFDCEDQAIWRMLCRNASNYLKALPQENFEIAIVVNAGGVLLMTNAHPELRELAAPLLERGARIKLCANALAMHEIKSDQLWPGVEIVPAGVVEIVRLQNEGYAYIKP